MFRKNYSIIEPREYDLSVFDIVDERKKAETHWYHIMPEQWAVFTTLFKRSDKPRTWGVMKVEIEKNGEPYMEFLRNYPSLPFLYIEQNGEEFAITSTDYQCITIINLTTFSSLNDIHLATSVSSFNYFWRIILRRIGKLSQKHYPLRDLLGCYISFRQSCRIPRKLVKL